MKQILFISLIKRVNPTFTIRFSKSLMGSLNCTFLRSDYMKAEIACIICLRPAEGMQ